VIAPARGLVAALAIALSASISVDPAAAQDSARVAVRDSASASSVPARRAAAVRITGAAPALDGRLDDAAWEAAPVITGFSQKEPAEGEPSTERTEVRIVYDDQAIYVGARMHAADPRTIQAPVSRRDVFQQAEMIAISLDTYHDRRTAYTFGVTAAGARVDRYHAGDSEDADDSYAPVWEARAARDSAGWTAEMRIPFSQLRFTPGEAQRWGINLRRWMPSREEDAYWIVVPRSVSAWASRFGELEGITGIRPRRRVELMPYASTGAALRTGVHPRDPFREERETEVRVGGDVKIGLGSNLTLDATVNPDFAQVDADPAEVNLSAFETFFSERRPFFTEGSALLSGGGNNFFYSRRIGARPRGPADADFVDRPDASTILGAAKLTGRLPSGLSVGVLAAVTGRERAATFDTASGTFGRIEVEPPTGYAVARLEQELGRSGSTAGVTLTAVGREMEEGSALASLYNRAAVTGGADWRLRLGGGTYVVGGNLGFSHVAGDSLAILRVQRSSARYFGRPDAEYARLDPGRTALSGYTAGLNAAKISGKHWLWDAFVSAESPGLELNDAGRLGTADGIAAGGSLRWRETRGIGPFRRLDVYLTPSAEWNYGGAFVDGVLWVDAEATWKNFWRTWVSFLHVPRYQSATLTRGGPLAGGPAVSGVILQVLNSSSSRLRWNGRVYYAENEYGDPTVRLSGGLSVRPGPRWQLSIDPNFLRTTPVRQYVATFDGGPAATFGKTYVFAAVERRELTAPVRLSYLFTPDLSLELYAEPFASSGRWTRFGELPEAGAPHLRPLGGGTTAVREGDRVTVARGEQSETVADFDVRSFRSNAVLRWEWRPGSSLFVVWQQDRAEDRERIGRVVPGSLFETLDAPGNNYLAVKVTYWLPLR